MRSPDGHPIIAATLDWTMSGVRDVRDRVVPHATGHVLEIGVGTGLNLPVYDPARVTTWVGVEPDPHMLARARGRADAAPFPAQLVQAGAEALPFPDAAFDTVVVTFALCTIPDVDAAVREIARVLAPGGTLWWAEHTVSHFGPTAAVQGWLDPVWGWFSGGCHITRDPVALLTAAGLEVALVGGEKRPPWTLTPVRWGHARRPG